MSPNAERSLEQSPRRCGVAEVPAWAAGNGDFASVLTAFALAGLEGRWVRLSAETQRRLFGAVLLGRKAVKSDGSKISVFKTQAFGQDFDIWFFRDHASWERLRRGEQSF